MRKSFFGLWLALAVSASGAEIKITFSDFAAGQSPTNFHNALAGAGQPGDWKIVMDESPSAFAPLMPQITPTASRHPAARARAIEPGPDRRAVSRCSFTTARRSKISS